MKPFPADEQIAPATHKGWIEVVLPPPSDAEIEEKAAAQVGFVRDMERSSYSGLNVIVNDLQ